MPRKNDDNRISNRQISINMIANIISYSSNLIISFVLTPFLINTLGKEIYSFYPLANTIVSYMSILTNSLNTMASRFVTVSLVQRDNQKANQYFSSVLASNIIISAVLLVPMIVIVVFVDKILNVPINAIAAVQMLFSFVFASMLVNVLGSVYGIATFAKNRIDLRSLREIITAVVRLALFVLLYKFLPPSIVYVGIVTLIVAVINLGFQYFYTKILLPEIKLKRSYISKSCAMELLSSSTWNMIFVFGNTLLAGMTLLLSNLFFGAEASGLLSIVQTVPQFINGVISMLVGVFFPVITYRIAQKDINGTVDQILKAEHIIAIFACAVISVFSALGQEFFSLWVPGEDSKYLSVLSILTITPHLIIACTWILTNLNVALNKVKTPALFTIIIGGMNVIIAWFSVKVLKAPLISLPAISTILQIVWAGIFLPIYAAKELGISVGTFYPPLIKSLVASVLTFSLIHYFKQFLIMNNWSTFILWGIIFGICSLVCFALIVLGPNQILRLSKKVLNMGRK